MDFRLAPQAESELDEVWYFLATQSSNVDAADRMVNSIAENERLIIGARERRSPSHRRLGSSAVLHPRSANTGSRSMLRSPVRRSKAGTSVHLAIRNPHTSRICAEAAINTTSNFSVTGKVLISTITFTRHWTARPAAATANSE
jgi:plasmid stabilization system protein ParE